MKKMDKIQIAELVQKAQTGDSEAMNQLLQTAYKNVLFQCRRIMKHSEDAEDMAQEVLIKIYETLGTLREPERFISWANTIATRRCINERMRNPKDLQFVEDEEGNSILDNLEELDQQSMPEAALDSEETRRMIRELIDKLPETQRVAVMSYYNAEMSVKEIAELLGVSENTVKSRLSYGRKAIEKGVKGRGSSSTVSPRSPSYSTSSARLRRWAATPPPLPQLPLSFPPARRQPVRPRLPKARRKWLPVLWNRQLQERLAPLHPLEPQPVQLPPPGELPLPPAQQPVRLLPLPDFWAVSASSWRPLSWLAQWPWAPAR